MITYLEGDATNPIGKGLKLISHISNDLGAWGAGFVLALSRNWDEPEAFYRSQKNLVLGDVQYVDVEDDIVVCNMIGQHGIGYDINGLAPIRYDAVRECLRDVNRYAVSWDATIHAPRFGAGLSGGCWETIENIVKEELTVDVYIYDLPKRF